MADSYTSVSHQGYFSRIAESIKGILFGIVLFVISVPLLFWNEGRAVHTAQELTEGAANVVSVPADTISPGNEGKEIHFTGDASGETLSDAIFGVSAQAVHLKRTVEIYQWKEDKKDETTKDTIGGGTTTKTNYSYNKTWSDPLIESSRFNEPSGHQNPRVKPIEDQTSSAKDVKVGAFTLSPELVSKIDNYESLPATEVPDTYKADGTLEDGMIYIAQGMDTTRPTAQSAEIGDTRVSFSIVRPQTVSVISQQSGSTLSPYQTKNGAIDLLYVGNKSAQDMFSAEQANNTTLAWILRLVGFVMMAFGMFLVLNPLKVLADVIGILGDIVGIGLGIACVLLAFVLSLVTIAIAWVVYRPVVGIGLLVLAAAGVALLVKMRKPRKVVA